MKSWTLLLALCAMTSAVLELTLHSSDSMPHGVAQAVENRRRDTIATNSYGVTTWKGRGGTGQAYYLNITAGSPPQPQIVQLDTGSSDFYLIPSESADCNNASTPCYGGTFDRKASSTYAQVGNGNDSAFGILYGGGTKATGPFGTDVVGIGNLQLSNVQFGLGLKNTATGGPAIGLMGLRWSSVESNYTGNSPAYPIVPDILVKTGTISSHLFSIFLNSIDQITGSILFGGVDTSKYTGDLVVVDMIPDLTDPSPRIIYTFNANVTGVYASTKDGVTGIPVINPSTSTTPGLPVLLDTGTSPWVLPKDMYKALMKAAFSFADSDGACSCAHLADSTTVTVEFSSAVNITVPFTSLISRDYQPDNTPTPWGNGKGDTRCFVNIEKADGNKLGNIQPMGAAIMRSMYTVFDLDNAQFAIAQAAVNSTAPANVIEIPAGSSGIARALAGKALATPVPTQTVSNVGPVTATTSYSAITITPPIGTATGTAALPLVARPKDSAGSCTKLRVSAFMAVLAMLILL